MRNRLRIFLVLMLATTLPFSVAASQLTLPEGVMTKIAPWKAHDNREKPLIAVVGENTFTELTDFVIPYALLKEANVADVFTVAIRPGPIQLFPAFKVEADMTANHFDRLYPLGADYILVPAVHETDNPELLRWIQEQQAKGSTIVGICDGVWVLGHAGLLDGHYATGHWYSREDLEEQYPKAFWVQDRRYVADGKIVTTTGVTASVPVTLALIEAIAGEKKAATLAAQVGASDWSVKHDSRAFALKTSNVVTVALNYVSFWQHDTYGIQVSTGDDDIKLAFSADSYSRTYQTQVFSYAKDMNPVKLKSGLTLLPDRVEGRNENVDRWISLIDNETAMETLNRTLRDIGDTYGFRTAALVALQLEYKVDN